MKLKISNKNKLSNKLITFLPILKSSFEEIDEIVKEVEQENPLIDVKYKRTIAFSEYVQNSSSEIIENRLTSKSSLYDELRMQILSSRIFPSQKSQRIALRILEDIDVDGYFSADEESIARELGVDVSEVQKVRMRFSLLEPAGVGAKDMKESFLFQLENVEVDDELFEFCVKLIEDFDSLEKYQNHKLFKKALNVISQFNITPALEYVDNEYIIPDIIVLNENGNLEIKINEDYYPDIQIKADIDNSFAKEKLKEAKSLIEALELRKSTLYKLALMIVELQYDFFLGGALKPMKLQDVADELGYALSTISRAISNKYILCNRGLIPIKSFFTKALDDNTSNAQIKDYIKYLIQHEDKERPLNDETLAKLTNEKFNIKIVRRTVTKYRKALDIPTSRQRKRDYKISIS
ncbi:MAG: RNA polymerase factor sigma-54 [Epsilonproteobacteria bacterium]|nr:RNA polymerase factor sigma-54 [Campylobacterota bacterium]